MSVDTTMRIVNRSSGSFLAPPGHPTLRYSIEAGPREGTQRYETSGPNLIAGLDYALTNEYGDCPPAVVAEAKRIFAESTLVRSELWERGVYGYFRNCYSPDGVDRNVSNCLIVGQAERVDKGSQYDSLNRGDVVRADDPRCTPEHHLGYLTVKQYFPEAKPRPELMLDGNGLYGQLPCTKCETLCQYEAKVDAFAEPITAKLGCPNGGEHTVTVPPIKKD